MIDQIRNEDIEAKVEVVSIGGGQGARNKTEMVRTYEKKMHEYLNTEVREVDYRRFQDR